MDKLTFVSSVIESVAWPIAAAFVAISLRDEIRKLLSRTKRIKYNETEFEFNEEIKAASEEASKTFPEARSVRVENNKSIELARLSPRGAILEAWLGVEEALNGYSSRHGLDVDDRRPFTLQNIAFHNADYHKLGRGVVDMLKRLRKIRNDAVHLRDVDIELESAIEFIALSNRVISRIEEA